MFKVRGCFKHMHLILQTFSYFRFCESWKFLHRTCRAPPGEIRRPAEDISANAKTLIFTATLTCGNLVTKAGNRGKRCVGWRGRKINLEKTERVFPFLGKMPDCWEMTSDFKQRDLNSHIGVASPCWRMNITSCLFCMRKLCQLFEAVWPLLGSVFRHILKRKARWLMSLHVCLNCIPMFRNLRMTRYHPISLPADSVHFANVKMGQLLR